MSASGNYGPCRVAEAIIGGGDLSVGASVRALLEAEITAAGGRLRGMRHGVAWDANEAISNFASRTVPLHQVMDPKFREGFAQLAPLGLSFESWQYHPQLPDAIDLARAFPDTTIILNHVGGVLGVGPYAGRRQEILAGWRKDIKELAKCPNVYCKLGGIGMVSFGFDFHERDCRPRPKISPRRGGSISSPASRLSASIAACSKATSRRTSSRAAIPSCGTPSSASPPVPRRAKDGALQRHRGEGLSDDRTLMASPFMARHKRAVNGLWSGHGPEPSRHDVFDARQCL